jgi:hypothetical protein
MRAPAATLACALALALPASVRAQSTEPAAPADLVVSGSLGGGVEAGLDAGRAGLLEAEAVVGWDLEGSAARTGFTWRPELGVALGLAPDFHVALRPGLRLSVPGTPLWLRVAADWANARGRDPHWRWLLVGAAWEVRMTSVVGFTFEADTGVKLAGSAGLPLLVRAGATFRF